MSKTNSGNKPNPKQNNNKPLLYYIYSLYISQNVKWCAWMSYI